jgi:Leucine-rich repeat (LRR) protein
MKLSTLNATGNPNLQFVDCSNNELTYLGLSNVPSLEYLSVHNNKLTTLPLSSFGNVKLLDCSMNLLTKVFDGAMKKLIFLYCSGNQLSGKYVFDAPDGNVERKSNEARVSVLSTLKAFDCSNNKLTALDLNTLPGLENLNCSGNVLDSLNISVLASLDTLDASNNPTLSCIQVSDANAANAKLHYKKDNGTNYAVNCRITSLDENESISKQVLYPNPAITHINVDLYANAQVNIVNSIGELVYSKLFNKGTSELNVENLNAGLYFVEIKYADFSTVEKLVVRK